MPANLPPEYFEAEKGYRAARSTADKIARLEELLRTIPKHKGTDKLRADFRRRLSKLKATDQARKRPGRRESAFHIDREGAGQVVVVGPTNVGKSALVAALTNATPEVVDAPFTTWEPTPGMMPMENVQIQLIDTPPLNTEFVEPELLDLIRRSDLILLVVDLQTDPIQELEDTIALLQEHRIVPQRLRDRYTEQQGLTFIP
ncbi:MAG: GTPase, partial [Anaerolineae bacterium]